MRHVSVVEEEGLHDLVAEISLLQLTEAWHSVMKPTEPRTAPERFSLSRGRR